MKISMLKEQDLFRVISIPLHKEDNVSINVMINIRDTLSDKWYTLVINKKLVTASAILTCIVEEYNRLVQRPIKEQDLYREIICTLHEGAYCKVQIATKISKEYESIKFKVSKHNVVLYSTYLINEAVEIYNAKVCKSRRYNTETHCKDSEWC